MLTAETGSAVHTNMKRRRQLADSSVSSEGLAVAGLSRTHVATGQNSRGLNTPVFDVFSGVLSGPQSLIVRDHPREPARPG